MPRYYFNSADGEREIDDLGQEFPDDAAAQRAAVKYAGEILKGDPGSLFKSGRLRIDLYSEDGNRRFAVAIEALR